MTELLGFWSEQNPDIIARTFNPAIPMTTGSAAPALVQLVFFGEIVNGHAPDDAKRKLAAAVGIAPGQIEDVFSGRRVVLKKSLSAEEAPRYLAKLERIGIVARAEPQPNDPADPESRPRPRPARPHQRACPQRHR